jgi:hypothetical protein
VREQVQDAGRLLIAGRRSDSSDCFLPRLPELLITDTLVREPPHFSQAHDGRLHQGIMPCREVTVVPQGGPNPALWGGVSRARCSARYHRS